MRIGICGSHSTGKTTLVEALRTESIFSDYFFDINVTRWVKAAGFPINQDTNDASQEINLTKRIVHLVCHDNIISDRTILDVLAYSALSENITDRSLSYQKKLIEAAVKFYDILIYLPITIELVDDGIRAIDPEYRKEVDIYIQTYLQKYGQTNNKTIIEVTGSIRERVTKILEVMNEFKPNQIVSS